VVIAEEHPEQSTAASMADEAAQLPANVLASVTPAERVVKPSACGNRPAIWRRKPLDLMTLMVR